jgi:N-acetyl-anhydromuramyl-L-alanine amidase AmpD
MLDVIKYGEFKPTGKQKKKNQIILAHTSRNATDYLNSLKYRYNGKYKKIPNYLITREGKIIKLLENIEHSDYFVETNVNRNAIIISLENLGWLQKEQLRNYYVNWIGDIYKGETFDKKWRDYFFWQPYTEEQINSTVQLCVELFEEMKIKSNVIGHNTKITGIEKYEGVVTRSNFDVSYNDVNPSFNFEKFLNKIEDEQQARRN